jgi:organic hydroperoxide reductase OsmC/OhrA
MSTYTATVRWRLGGQDFLNDEYSRAHDWVFDGGHVVPASASPHIVPLPNSVEEHVDPEEAFIASLSSCHMLFFLSLAMDRGILVEEYVDEAEGVMEKNDKGRIAITRVTLRPRARYGGEKPDPGQVEKLHHRAHDLCFIANSVRSEIVTEIVA